MKNTIDTAIRLHSLFERAVSHLQSPLLLAVRLYWGWQFFQTGLGKLMHIPKVMGFFTSLGIPFPAFNAYFVGSLELWVARYCFSASGRGSSRYRSRLTCWWHT